MAGICGANVLTPLFPKPFRVLKKYHSNFLLAFSYFNGFLLIFPAFLGYALGVGAVFSMMTSLC